MTSAVNSSYYDEFSQGYDHGRDRGYHKLIDDQAAALVRQVGTGGDALEIGCGTGLIMERVKTFARSVKGIDISPGMLEHAKRRGLDVCEGSATELPFEDESFDVVYSFKVLAHISEIDKALSEMARVTRPGGHLVFDAYNRDSVRYLIKRAWGPQNTSSTFDEAAIGTRFDSPAQARARAEALGEVVDVSGIRILTVHPAMLRIPLLGGIAERAEWALMNSPLSRFAGFVVMTVRKPG
ncbi:MAG: class I SAM-dependent methyltransferase [Nannocystaceae bacterium]|nr:class I SAM-dependent methyltransferase [Nannocystaceae bacterium]